MEPKSQENDQYKIQVLDKCLELLGIVGQHPQGITLVDLARTMGLPKSSVFRYLATLESRQYVERLDGERFRLGIKLLELGEIVRANLDIRGLALPMMNELLHAYQETVNLAMLSGAEIVYVEMLESNQALRMAAQRGSRDQVHSTALGKAMLAFLDPKKQDQILSQIKFVRRTAHSIMSCEALRTELEAIRRLGYSTDRMENEEGVHCVGAPIFNHEGVPVAAVSISGPSSRLSLDRLAVIGPELSAKARNVSRKLGYSGKS